MKTAQLDIIIIKIYKYVQFAIQIARNALILNSPTVLLVIQQRE